MHDDSPQAWAAARVLAERRMKGLAGPRLPETMRPNSLSEAMAIQSAVSALLIEAGDAVAGWKCGTPGPGKLVVAPIFASTTHQGVHCPAWAHEGQVKIEPELAFVLGRDLPPRAQAYEPAEVDAAIAHTHLALELIDTRYSDASELSFAEKLADGLVNQGLFIGPEVDGERARGTAEMPIRISVEGQADTERPGQHPDPLPRLPLYWLAEYLRSTGVGLRAGQAIITGSYAGSFGLPVDRALALRFGDLGTLTVQLQARERVAL
jgi:2-keto-4-pentenoate hydratase